MIIKKTVIRITSICTLIFLAGCATPVATQVSRMDALEAKPLDFENLDYKALAAQGKTKLKFGADLPLVRVDQDKSYVAAYELPTKRSGLLAIRTFFNGSAYKQNYSTGQLTAQYMHPYVVVLDSGKQPIMDGEPALQFVLGSMFGEQADHLVGWVQIPDHAKYLVILSNYAEPTPIPASTRHSSQAYMVGNTPVVSHSSSKMTFERSPEGELKIFWDEWEE